ANGYRQSAARSQKQATFGCDHNCCLPPNVIASYYTRKALPGAYPEQAGLVTPGSLMATAAPFLDQDGAARTRSPRQPSADPGPDRVGARTCELQPGQPEQVHLPCVNLHRAVRTRSGQLAWNDAPNGSCRCLRKTRPAAQLEGTHPAVRNGR